MVAFATQSKIQTTGADVVPIGANGAGKSKLLSAAELRTFASLYSAAQVDTLLSAKQATLVSGTNLKSINGTTLLGSGDLTVSATPAGSSGQLQFNSAGAFGGAAALGYMSSGTLFTVTGQAASDVLYCLKGAASQSGNLLETRNNSNTLLSYINAAGSVVVPAGSSSAPGLIISQPIGSTINGFFSHSPPSVSLAINSTPVIQYNGSTYVNIHSSANMGFSAGGNANNVNADIGWGRSSAGVLEINDCNTGGTKGTFRDLILRNLGVNGAISAGGGVGIVSIKNATTVPTTNPTGGGVMYCESGALKFRGSSGTVTTLGVA